jgi:hypothetical protein
VATLEQIIEAVTGVLERISSTWTGTVFIMTSRIQEEGDSQ